jgi:hypothetical protein
MILTEDEAAERWCPQTSRKLSDESSRCLGSKCMAWRWPNPPAISEENDEPLGYCGLAGPDPIYANRDPVYAEHPRRRHK